MSYCITISRAANKGLSAGHSSGEQAHAFSGAAYLHWKYYRGLRDLNLSVLPEQEKIRTCRIIPGNSLSAGMGRSEGA
jgi:hypothetical protein